MRVNKKITTYLLFFVAVAIFWWLHAMSRWHTTTIPVYLSYRNYVYEEGDASGKTKVDVTFKARGYQLFFIEHKYAGVNIPVDIMKYLQPTKTNSVDVASIIKNYFTQKEVDVEVVTTVPEKIILE